MKTSSSAGVAVDDAAEIADRLNELRSNGRKPRRDPEKQFRVRHFTGPMVHAEQLAHLRVAHLTDMHFGRVTPMEVQYTAVELTNREKPDVVVVTGDYVCHSQLYLDALTDVFQRFNAPVVCVLGNHDHWSGSHEVSRAIKRAGAEVLDNAHTVLTLRHQHLQLVGLDDAYTGHASREKATKGLRRDLATIGLSHIAEEADGLWHSHVPLVLSGHTHAGQVTVARLHEFAIGKFAGHRYVHGLYGTRSPEPKRGAVYVGAGVGAAVVPLRIGERGKREITIFELGNEAQKRDEHHAEQEALPGRKPSPRKDLLRAMAVEKKKVKRSRKKAKNGGSGGAE